MVALPCRVFEGGGDVSRFQERIVAEDFLAAGARGQKIEHVFDPDAQATQARAVAALGGIDGYPVQFAHGMCPVPAGRDERMIAGLVVLCMGGVGEVFLVAGLWWHRSFGDGGYWVRDRWRWHGGAG